MVMISQENAKNVPKNVPNVNFRQLCVLSVLLECFFITKVALKNALMDFSVNNNSR
jgi:hypothetical protein